MFSRNGAHSVALIEINRTRIEAYIFMFRTEIRKGALIPVAGVCMTWSKTFGDMFSRNGAHSVALIEINRTRIEAYMFMFLTEIRKGALIPVNHTFFYN